MILNIGNRDYEMKFGIGFLKELDSIYPMVLEQEGQKINSPFTSGFNYLNIGLSQCDVVTLYNCIKAATSTLKSKPSNDAIEEFLGDSDLEVLSEDFLTGLRHTPMLKLKMREIPVIENQIQK